MLGAGGTIAPAIVRDLADSDEVESSCCCSTSTRAARAAVAAEHGGGKARAGARWTRARGARLRRSTAATCWSTRASYRVNLDAMQACLEAGCHYLDLGGLYQMTGEQLELQRRASQPPACWRCSGSARARARPT